MRSIRSLARSLLKPKTTYDPLVYWNRRKNPNSASPALTQAHIDYVRKHVAGCRRILDFGPGVGRIIPAYRDLESIEGYDISSAYEDRLLQAASEHSIDFNLRIERNMERLPYEDARFDASVSVSVLLHQTPNHITGVMRELARVADKVIIVSHFDAESDFDRISGVRHKGQQYCFNYDYYEICRSNGWRVLNGHVDPANHQIYFVYAGTAAVNERQRP
ncbi:MAG TPA: class I SAM-dependent methyltransferase [Longimicrobiales bacterium]|nr:class I SAM-dependent methyltransferase [Longimicrobiales bacterium]